MRIDSKAQLFKKMVDYFKESNVGFVQSPQVFYNSDPFQYNLNLDDKIPNEQDFFMREVQAGRARYNALFHVGTNALFSRKAIDDIGGIPTGSITEDMATGMLLSLEKPRYRRSERRIVDYKSSLILSDSTVLNCTIHDISDSGIRISINRNKLGNLDVGDIIKVKIGNDDIFCRILRCRENNFGCRFISLSREKYLDIIKYEFHNENGYYNVENENFVYNKLEDENDDKLESVDDIFSSSVVTGAFPRMNMKESPKPNYIAAKPIENKNMAENQNHIKIGHYANLQADVILKDVAKLNDTQITIIKMYKEITDLKEQLEKDHRD